MWIWLDDLRPAPEGWTWAKTYAEAVALLERGEARVVSLDHDLGDVEAGREMTGYDVLLHVVQMKMDGRPIPEDVRIHSANPVGRQRMQGVIDRYLRREFQ